MSSYWGGLDLAQRVDHSALIVLQLEEGELHQIGEKVWGHIDYSNVFDDISRYHKKVKFNRIGYDRTGVGDGLRHLMNPVNLYQPIVTTNNTKVQIINLVNGLFQDGILHIQAGTELEKQMREQQFKITDAGNTQYNHPSGRHDDLFWALGYACYTASPYMNGTIKPIMRTQKNDNREDLESRIERELQEMIDGDV